MTQTQRFEFTGRTAVITGAGSGIGRALAQALAARRCNLALADRDEAGLRGTVDALDDSGLQVTQHRLDVADQDAVAAFPEVVGRSHKNVSLLINNAGVALSGTFEQVAPADFDWLMSINFFGVVRMTRAFLPLLRQADEGRLVNISSLFGLIAPPGQTAYCASKYAVRGFSELLRQELRRTRVGVTVVHPGGVATSIARNARISGGIEPTDLERQKAQFERALVLPPASAAEIILRAVERRRDRVLVGNDAKMAAAVERFAPVTYWRILERLSSAGRRSGGKA